MAEHLLFNYQLEKFNPKVHTVDTHWFHNRDMEKTEDANAVNKFFNHNGITDAPTHKARIPVIFGTHVVRDLISGQWGCYLEWEYIKLLRANKILRVQVTNGNRDNTGRKAKFESVGLSRCDYILSLEYC